MFDVSKDSAIVTILPGRYVVSTKFDYVKESPSQVDEESHKKLIKEALLESVEFLRKNRINVRRKYPNLFN